MNIWKLYAKPDTQGNIGNWQERHMDAIYAPHKGFEKAIVQGIDAWVNYAAAHQKQYESKIGEDRIIGEFWTNWGLALKGLLDGETGRLDCGTLNSIILDTFKECGVVIED